MHSTPASKGLADCLGTAPLEFKEVQDRISSRPEFQPGGDWETLQTAVLDYIRIAQQ